jgi:hypothetical protein
VAERDLEIDVMKERAIRNPGTVTLARDLEFPRS